MFPATGQFTPRSFPAAEVAAKAVLDEAPSTPTVPARWDTAYGSSGTIGAVSDVLTAAGYGRAWSPAKAWTGCWTACCKAQAPIA